MKGIVFIYGIYLLVLIYLLLLRIAGVMSFNCLNACYLIFGIIGIGICCGYRFRNFLSHFISTQKIMDCIDNYNDDRFLIKSGIFLMVPLLILFIVNYLV